MGKGVKEKTQGFLLSKKKRTVNSTKFTATKRAAKNSAEILRLFFPN